MPNRTPPSEWGRLFNFAGHGFIHLEVFPEEETAMCCEIMVIEEDVFLWMSDDLIYIDFPS